MILPEPGTAVLDNCRGLGSYVMALAFAAAVPFLCLGMLMWLARLEETLTDGLDSPRATREPAPVVAADAVPTTIEVAPAPAAVAAA